MTFEEYLTVRDLHSKIVWICDYRFKNNYIQKPIRHIPPTEVKVCYNSDLPKNKRIYYSNVHFRPLNKDGSPSKSRIIAPYDNTGFRSYKGIALHVFFKREEAVEFYLERLTAINRCLLDERERVLDIYDSSIAQIGSIAHKYIKGLECTK